MQFAEVLGRPQSFTGDIERGLRRLDPDPAAGHMQGSQYDSGGVCTAF
ncbi:hypothetical protein [Zestomonas thermotolerans]